MPFLSVLNVGFSSNMWLPKYLSWKDTFLELCLSGTSTLDSDVNLISQSCIHLERLDLQECPKITDASIASLSALTRLNYLDISKCMKLRNPKVECASLKTLSCRFNQNCKTLSFASPIEVLDISGCEAWDAAFDNSLVAHGSSLKHLWMRRKGGVTDELLDILCNYCPELQAVNLSEISSFSVDALKKLVTSCTSLQRVYVNSCSVEGLEEFLLLCEEINPFVTITKNT